MQRRVVVTGLGAVTPLGAGVKAFWSGLLQGDCGVVSTRNLPFDIDTRWATIPSQVVASVPRSGPSCWNSKEWLSDAEAKRMATFSQFAVAAAKEALDDAGWDSMQASEEELEMAGVCFGSGIGSFVDMYNTSSEFQKHGHKKTSPFFIPRLLINLAAGHISMRHSLRGPNHAASTACTTGLHSVGDATRFILHGDADLMVAGGSESAIHPLAVSGFAAARSLCTSFNDSPESASRPFDGSRCGFVMGEGAGALVLEELSHAKKRGVERIYAEIRGYGLSADAHHITAPHESGRGASLSMKRALVDAGIRPRDVDYVNAHATGTLLGDRVENRAVKSILLGSEGKENAEEINVSSIKGAIGHLLGAAGAVETIATALAVSLDKLPPTLNLDDPGGAESDDRETFNCNYVPFKSQDKRVRVALTNSFGFGGTNASLCLTKFKEN